MIDSPSAQPVSRPWLLFFAVYAVLQIAWLGWTSQQYLVPMAGCAAAIYAIVLMETRSHRWALIGAGLFAAARLDAAERDCWTMLLVLVGCHVLNYGRSQLANCSGMLLLVGAFWLRPEAGLFALGGMLFLLLREDARDCILPAVVGFAAGPLLFFLSPSQISGQGLELTAEGIARFAEILGRQWLLPGFLTATALMTALEKNSFRSIWIFLVPVAFTTALLGMASPGAGMGVFVPFEVWMILIAVVALERLTRQLSRLAHGTVWPQLGLSIAFLALL